jgi:DNA-binding MarR family transcriptional regulator
MSTPAARMPWPREEGLVERRPAAIDRRSYALRLTAAGRAQLEALGRVARQHQDDVCAALSEAEREQLRRLLGKMAEQQGLRPRAHPGFAKSPR